MQDFDSWKKEMVEKRIRKCTEYSKTIPAKYRALWKRTYNGTEVSPRQVIKAHCQNCVNYEDTINQIRYCGCITCPSWDMRPYQSMKEVEELNEVNVQSNGNTIVSPSQEVSQ